MTYSLDPRKETLSNRCATLSTHSSRRSEVTAEQVLDVFRVRSRVQDGKMVDYDELFKVTDQKNVIVHNDSKQKVGKLFSKTYRTR